MFRQIYIKSLPDLKPHLEVDAKKPDLVQIFVFVYTCARISDLCQIFLLKCKLFCLFFFFSDLELPTPDGDCDF